MSPCDPYNHFAAVKVGGACSRLGAIGSKVSGAGAPLALWLPRPYTRSQYCHSSKASSMKFAVMFIGVAWAGLQWVQVQLPGRELKKLGLNLEGVNCKCAPTGERLVKLWKSAGSRSGA